MPSPTKKPDPTKDGRSLILRLGAAVLAAALIIGGLLFFELRRSLEMRQAQELSSIRDFAAALAGAIDKNLAMLDLGLLCLADEFGADMPGGIVDSPDLRARLVEMKARLPGLDGIGAVDPRGDNIWGPSRLAQRVANISDTSFFREIGEGKGFVFTDPKRSLLDGEKLIVAFGRPVRKGDGRFGGAVYGVISRDYFSQLLAPVRPGPSYRIDLVDLEGHIVFSFPEPFPSAAAVPASLDAGLLPWLARAAEGKGSVLSFTDPGGSFSARTMYALSFPAGPSYSVGVLVSRSTAVFLAGWRLEHLWTILGFLALLALAGLIALMVYKDRARRAERLNEALEEKKTLRRYLDIASVMLGTFDLEGNITLINKRGCEILGCAEGEILGLNWFESFVPRGEVEARRKAVMGLFGSGAQDVDFPEARICSRDGRDRVVSLHVSLLADSGGRRICSLFSGEDVTELLMAREREKRYHEVLELIVSGQGLGIVLGYIARSVEAEHPGDICSIRLRESEGESLVLGAAPGLVESSSPLPEAMFLPEIEADILGRFLSSDDIVVEELPGKFESPSLRGAASSLGLASMWIKPMRGKDASVAGMITIYRRTRGAPEPQDLVRLDNAADTVLLAVERQRSLMELKESESRYRSIFERSAVSLWEEDVSELRSMIRRLREKGVEDLGSWIDLHPDFLLEAVSSIRVVDVNEATLRLYGAREKDELLGSLIKTLDRDCLGDFKETVLAVAESRNTFSQAGSALTLDGRRLDISIYVYVPKEDAPQPSVLVSVFDITASLRASRELERAVEERGLLLKELQHRVKNTLSLVASLLSLDEERMEDERARMAFRDASNRVLAMSEVYERLYRSDEVSAVDLGGYINELATTLVDNSLGDSSRVGLVLDADPVAIDIKRAISLGLILNELVTNVLKYAFPGGRAGELRIRLRSRKGSICLGVEDDGVGMPPGFDPAKSDSLGTKLVALLVEQLGATMSYLEGGGTRVEICFPETLQA